MIELSYGEILDHALAAIAEKGDDYVYQAPDDRSSCWYVHRTKFDATPGCIVGHILYRAGVSLDDLTKREGGVRSLLCSLKRGGILKVDDYGEIFLTVAQAIQDKKGVWVAAYDGGTAAVMAHRAIISRSE